MTTIITATHPARQRAGRVRPCRRAGFTMIEIVVAIALVAMISTAAMMALNTTGPERELQRPAVKIKTFARQALSLARGTQRPHSIFMGKDYFVLRETNMRDEDLEEVLDPSEKRALFKVRDEDEVEESAGTDRMVERYNLAEGTQIEIMRLNQKEWHVPKNESWDFYTSGICDPISIRFATEDGYIEMEFNPLTAKLQPDGEAMEIYKQN